MPTPFFNNVSALQAATVPLTEQWVETVGYAVSGDKGACRRVRGANVPGAVQSADGAYWEIAEPELRLEMFGADGSVAKDTAALAAAVSKGLPIRAGGEEYYIGEGCQPASGCCFEGSIRFKLKMGPGGFSSKETAIDRYSIQKTLLHWYNVEGGGFDQMEVYGDGGGDYVVIPIAITGGLTKRAWHGRFLHLHDQPLINGGVVINSTGAAKPWLDGLLVSNCGTSKSGYGWWTWLGTNAVNINPTGIVVDGDLVGGVASLGFEFGALTCRGLLLTGEALAKHDQQTDFVTVAGRDAALIGGNIQSIDAEDTGEPIDIQRSGLFVGKVWANRTSIGVKFVHGAKWCYIGEVWARNTYVAGVGFYGSASAGVTDTIGNTVGFFYGEKVSERPHFSGTLTGAGASTATLPSGRSPYDGDLTYVSSTLRITGGTGAGQELVITAYNGATGVVTVASPWATRPDATSTFAIYVSDNRTTVLFAGEGTGKVLRNTIRIGQVVNGGARSFNAYSNGSTVDAANRCMVDWDGGGAVTREFVSATPGNLQYVAGRKTALRVGMSATQVIANGATETAAFDTVEFDAAGEWDPALHRWVCKRAGIYRMTVRIRTSSTAVITLALSKNNSAVIIGAEGDGATEISDIISVAYGDFVNVRVSNSSGASFILGPASSLYNSVSITEVT